MYNKYCTKHVFIEITLFESLLGEWRIVVRVFSVFIFAIMNIAQLKISRLYSKYLCPLFLSNAEFTVTEVNLKS